MTRQRQAPDGFEEMLRGSVEPSARWVRVRLGGEVIAGSRSPLLLVQFGAHVMPTYFFHHAELAAGTLVDPVERNGRRLWTVSAGGRTVPGGAWTYIEPPQHLAALAGRVTFNWRDFDWFEEDEQVYVHARDPHKRVDIMPSSRHVQVIVDGQLVAESRRPTLLFETSLPARYYLPQEDIAMEYLRETAHTSACPYKGTARYWSVKIGDAVRPNLVWSYPEPLDEAAKIRGLLCFFNEKVDTCVDGEIESRPRTPWS